jgi:cell division septation protein DedD
MNQKTGRGLAAGAILIILVAVLYYLLSGAPSTTGPSKVAGPGPTTAAAPAKPASPAATQPTPQEPPAVPPIEPGGPPQGVAPGPEPEVTVPPPLEPQEHYGILAGNFDKYPDAAKLLARLKKQGKPAFIQRDPRDTNRFQVWVGPFSSQSEAQQAEKSLRATLKKPLKIEAIENPVPK